VQKAGPLVKAWNERPLKEAYPFVMVDAIMLKVRKDGVVRPQSALTPQGEHEGIPRGDGIPDRGQRDIFQLVRFLFVVEGKRALGSGPGGVRPPRRVG